MKIIPCGCPKEMRNLSKNFDEEASKLKARTHMCAHSAQNIALLFDLSWQREKAKRHSNQTSHCQDQQHLCA